MFGVFASPDRVTCVLGARVAIVAVRRLTGQATPFVARLNTVARVSIIAVTATPAASIGPALFVFAVGSTDARLPTGLAAGGFIRAGHVR